METVIADPKAAKTLLDALFEISGRLDASVATARDSCPEPEFVEYRRAVGEVLGDMWDQLIQPILKAHPHLAPDGLREDDS